MSCYMRMRATLARSVLTPGGGTSKGRPHEQTAADTHGAPTSRSRRSSSRASRRPSSGATRTFPSTKKSFDEAGFDPCALSSLDDLKKAPFICKQDPARQLPPTACLPRRCPTSRRSTCPAAPPAWRRWAAIPSTTWTSGASALRAASSMPTVTRTTSCTCATAYGLFTGGLGAHYGGLWMDSTVIPMSAGNTERQIRVLRGDGALASSAALPATPCTSPTRRSRWESTRPRTSTCVRGIHGAEPFQRQLPPRPGAQAQLQGARRVRPDRDHGSGRGH